MQDFRSNDTAINLYLKDLNTCTFIPLNFFHLKNIWTQSENVVSWNNIYSELPGSMNNTTKILIMYKTSNLLMTVFSVLLQFFFQFLFSLSINLETFVMVWHKDTQPRLFFSEWSALSSRKAFQKNQRAKDGDKNCEMLSPRHSGYCIQDLRAPVITRRSSQPKFLHRWWGPIPYLENWQLLTARRGRIILSWRSGHW